jgi:predicted secreted protein
MSPGVAYLRHSLATWRSVLFAALVCLVMPLPAAGQVGGEGPRTYWKKPANTHSVGTGMGLYTGNASGFNMAIPVKGAVLDTRAFIFNYVTFFNLFGRRNQVAFTQPFGSLHGTTTGRNPVNLDVAAKGRADTVAFWNVNLIGAPAQTLAEYRQWDQRTILDAQVFVTAPLGSHDDTRLLNIGSNRWTYRFGLPFVQSIGEFIPGKRTTFELVPSLTFFTDNTEARRGTATMAQDPLFKLEGHLTRDITKDLWVSVDALHQSGGETSLDGVKQDNSQSSLALGASVGFKVSETVSFLATWQNTLTDPDDGVNTNLVQMALRYSWNPTVNHFAKQQAEAEKRKREKMQWQLATLTAAAGGEREANIVKVTPGESTSTLTAAAGGERKANIVTVTPGESTSTVYLRVGDVLRVRLLLGTPGTDHSWTVFSRPGDPLQVNGEPVGERDPADEQRLAAPLSEVWTFRAGKEGRQMLHFEYRRPWESNVEPARTVTLDVTVAP